jgi:3-methyl-2-oxobutanoate hydroxymethyltransferase
MSTRPGLPASGVSLRTKLSLPELVAMKRRAEKLSVVTAYDSHSALLADAAGVELVLVGDTAAMVMLGYDSTLPVTLEEMIVLTRAVTRCTRRALVIGVLPFGSYEVSDEQAVTSAIRMLKEGGADLVKLEGGAGRMASRVRAIAESNIAVVGHVGLTPQSATRLGGFRAQGRTAASALALFADARALEQAGAVAVVLEAVPAEVASAISSRLAVPTVGIGAGAGCDGQVLVWHDLLGLSSGPSPRFVERYAELAEEIASVLERYVSDVRSGAFPQAQHTYSIPEEELARFEAGLPGRQPGD